MKKELARIKATKQPLTFSKRVAIKDTKKECTELSIEFAKYLYPKANQITHDKNTVYIYTKTKRLELYTFENHFILNDTSNSWNVSSTFIFSI